MKISCIILNYNVSNLTIALVNKIKAYSNIDSIIIVDNCSTDNSYEQLRALISEKVHVIQSERNGGYGYGNNWGIRYAKEHFNPDYILIANPDVEFTQQCLEAMKDVLTNDEKCALVTSVAYLPDGTPQKYCTWVVPTAIQYILSASTLLNRFTNSIFYDKHYFQEKTVCEVGCVLGALFLVKADVMISCGMYDEEVFLYTEETMLGYKLRECGYSSKIILNHGFIHHHSMSISKSFSSRIAKQKLLVRSKLIVLKNCYKLSSRKLKLSKIFFGITMLECRLISLLKG